MEKKMKEFMEGYVGVKFKAVQLPSDKSLVLKNLFSPFKKSARLLKKYGMTPKNGGNISLKRGNGMIITTSGANLGSLEEDEIVFADYYIYEPGWGWSLSDYVCVRADDIVFSTQSWVRKAVIAAQGLTPQTSLLVLASAGIEFIVPNIIIESPYSDELSKAKEKLKEERQGYLKALAKVGEEACERLSSGDYRGIAAWARNASLSILKPKAEHLKKKLKKMDRRLLKGIGFDSFQGEFPVTDCLVDFI